jgi:serine phosphatase RsbU (regulator of sigma subunit)
LIYREEAIGLIYLSNFGTEIVYEKEELELLTGISKHLAVAIANASMHEYMLKQQKMQLDLNYARRIQNSFLPATLPKLKNYRFQCIYKPAYEVGGDFYDVIPINRKKIAIAIGDVAGKGVSAALLMAKVTSEIRIAAHTLIEPYRVLHALNNIINTTFHEDCFITLLYCVLNIKTNEITIGNAGHLPVLICRDNTIIQSTSGINMALGFMPDINYEQEKMVIIKGDRLILYTDGIIDCKNKEGQFFGLPRLHGEVLNYCFNPDIPFCQYMQDVIKKFKGHGMLTDDLTLVEIIKTA